MDSSIKQRRLTVEQAVRRFHARTVSELRLLNAQLPGSMRLERREIDHLVDDLLSAVRETSRRRNASLFAKAIRLASGVLVHAIRRRSRRRRTAGAMVHWNRRAVDEARHSKDDTGALPALLAQEHLENPGDGMAGAEDRDRVA